MSKGPKIPGPYRRLESLAQEWGFCVPGENRLGNRQPVVLAQLPRDESVIMGFAGFLRCLGRPTMLMVAGDVLDPGNLIIPAGIGLDNWTNPGPLFRIKALAECADAVETRGIVTAADRQATVAQCRASGMREQVRRIVSDMLGHPDQYSQHQAENDVALRQCGHDLDEICAEMKALAGLYLRAFAGRIVVNYVGCVRTSSTLVVAAPPEQLEPHILDMLADKEVPYALMRPDSSVA